MVKPLSVPRYTRPEHVEKFFEQHDIPVADKPSFYWKAIQPAFELGFNVGVSPAGDIVVFTPHQHRKIYRGFKQTKYHLGMVLMHAMLNNPLH